uniref:Vitronectin n=1 Tax=Latimeria chalumnae TaxID=7897 RepID=H3ABB6_LATCH
LMLLPLLSHLVVGEGKSYSCVGRCEEGFNSKEKCQCDTLCKYYQSCCADFETTCNRKVSRGDVFTLPEDDYDYTYETELETSVARTNGSKPEPGGLEVQPDTLNYTTKVPTLVTEELDQNQNTETSKPEGEIQTLEEDMCNGKPFDGFTEMKNGSIFAFRGKYFYELEENSVMPGYPKLIEDVWGVEGPIDAVFTRINCQGKTHLFKGKQYWRFDDGVLDKDYPRNISDGFSNIPDDVDAAFALPANNFNGKEKVYFFKGDQYWHYEFQQQPSHEDCEETSMSTVFEHYTLMQVDVWENIFNIMFGGSSRFSSTGPHMISRDWRGVPGSVDAAMAGRIYVAPKAPSSRRKPKKQKRKYPKSYKKKWGKRRSRASHFNPMSEWDPMSYWDMTGDYKLDSDEDLDWLFPSLSQCTPIQSVYFFKEDQYYRVNLQTKRVDFVIPQYPRSISKYWLGCKVQEIS